MKFSTATALLPLTMMGSASAAFRGQHNKKNALSSRRLEDTSIWESDTQICTINHDIAQTSTEVEALIQVNFDINDWWNKEYDVKDGSYFKITVWDEPWAPADGSGKTYDGWCVDYGRLALTNTRASVDILTSYDGDLHMSETDWKKNAVDKPEKLPNIAYLINHWNVGDTIASCDGAVIGWLEMQTAIWTIIDDETNHDSSPYAGGNYVGKRNECVMRFIADDALNNGNGYIPDCTDPDEQIPLIYIIDHDVDSDVNKRITDGTVQTFEEGDVLHQVVISETNIHSIEGLCECVDKTPPPEDPPKGICYPVMDFEVDGDGSPTSAGDLAEDMWSAWGVKIVTNNNANKPAMLFDTANPTGGDTDLADDEEGMVLIISEDGDQTDPDDNAGGGTITFTFETPVQIDCLGIFDVEERQADGYIRMWNSVGQKVADEIMVVMADGEKKTQCFNQDNVAKMEVKFVGSGALTDIKFCENPPTTTEAPPTTTEAPPTTTQAPPTTTTTTDDVMTTTSKPGTQGDPHFKTHSGEMYDFHGGCDLVLLENPEFADGLGMTVHIRTKIETWWSYVEAAVLKIGDETVEIQQDQFHINGQAVDMTTVTDKAVLTKFAGFNFRYMRIGENIEAHIYINGYEKILLKTFKGFVKVQLAKEGSEQYRGSHGLLGRFPDGKRVARDGETFIEDVNEFGQEWQVQVGEPKLFHTYDDAWVVPAGQKCAMPDSSATKQKLRQRRLAGGLEMDAAEKACAHLESADDRKACVYDVMATQDVDMAGAW